MTAVPSQTLTSADYPDRPWAEPGTTQDRWVVRDVPPYLARLAQELEELLSLSDGWNSYGSRRVRPAAVRHALDLLKVFNWSGPLPSVSPTSRGGVLLEWGRDDEGVEIDFGPDGSLTVLVDLNGEVTDVPISNFENLALYDALTWAEKLG